MPAVENTICQNTKMVIKGIITAADWNDEDEITAVKILTSDEEEYFVQDKDKGSQLFDYLHQNVEAIIWCSKNRFGEKEAQVIEFEILPESMDMDDLEWYKNSK